MRYFERLAAGVDVLPLQHALQRHQDRWGENPLRTTFGGSPHHAAQDILLRFQAVPPDVDDAEVKRRIMGVTDCEWWPAWGSFPQARPLVFDLARRVEAARIGRVMLTRLEPGKSIDAHVDGGAYSASFDRYHIVVQANPGCHFRAEDEVVQMNTGDVWWFQNRVEHEVKNNSDDDRIHLIVDLQA